MATISDLGYKYLDTEYKTPTRTLSVEDIVEKKAIYGGDDNVRRDKVESLRTQFY